MKKKSVALGEQVNARKAVYLSNSGLVMKFRNLDSKLNYNIEFSLPKKSFFTKIQLRIYNQTLIK